MREEVYLVIDVIEEVALAFHAGLAVRCQQVHVVVIAFIVCFDLVESLHCSCFSFIS